ncbi:NACHT domain- and WD repeat-containing protein 1-like [Pecten maximus]|uniref:NACHT domain- and WD repeat-containing protein 1-like n=1 Tax=Pecten maximus TaxID=6579 RepID=UPI0014588FC9|nr:NACHT domain- and WD repeat-containing protein 1-like [Pecten maximus]
MAKIVRIFTSSTFTDTKFERNTWMSDAYPRVKAFCQAQGYEFQVVDMRWGVRDEASDDHSTTDLCLRELEMCQKLSTGPNFVSLLSHKYGYRSLPKVIEAEEFDKVFAAVKSDTAKNLLTKWYLRDYNAVPPVYVLSSISKHLPDSISRDKDVSKKLKAKQIWWDESDTMQEALKSAAEQALGEEEAKKYVISVTEKEIEMGLLSVDKAGVESGCAWFRRNIKDIDLVEPSYQLSRYMECLGNEETVKLAQSLLMDLKDRKMQNHLPSDNIIAYSVPWTDKGINPELLEHQKYLKQMSEDFVQKMITMVTKGIEERSPSNSSDPLETECLQHISFCQEKCKNFHGREVTLEAIKLYLSSADQKPLVVHGQSGCGKTSIMAKLAALVPSHCKNNPFKPAVIIRFIGTTPDSSNIRSLLTSIIQQIYTLYNVHFSIPEDIKLLVRKFKSALNLAKDVRPLVILLDSLDQLDLTNNGRSLNWIPRSLPANVKIIVSTLEDETYECFPALQQKIKQPANFVPVPILDKEDVNSIVSSWLSASSRTLTIGQRETLTNAFDTCPIPLFLKLSFDQACKWNSFSSPDEVRLQSTIRDSIDLLFSQLEVKHGKILVSDALGYLTAATNGLSEAELEDILSCDDDVLNDVYVYWTPPIRRLPPLLLVRLRTDLQEYIVERGADDVRVFYWYHRQFIEAARARYCGVEVIQNLHQGLADFFIGKWSNGNKKPCTDRLGNSGLEDRHSSAQPLRHGDKYNLRKLNNLPLHLTMARNLGELKEQCLLCLDFLQTRLLSSSMRNVMSDIQLALQEFPDDYAINMLHDCLQLSKQALVYDVHQLDLQLRDRLGGDQDEGLKRLCEQCNHISRPHLLPDQDILTKPGGQLVYLLSDHSAEVTGLDISMDGKTIVTCAADEEHSVKMWNLEDGTLIKSFNKLGRTPIRVHYIAKDSLILAAYEGDLVKAIQLTGEVAYTVRDISQYWLGGHDKEILVKLMDDTAVMYNTSTGKKKSKVKTKKNLFMSDQIENLVHGVGRYIVVTEIGLYKVTLLDLEKEEFSHWIDVFKPPPKNADDVPNLSVDMVCVSPDEQSFVVSSIVEGDFLFYSTTTLQKTRVMKGNTNDVGQCLLFSPDCKRLAFSNLHNIVVYDLETEERQDILPHLSGITKYTCASWKTLVTLCEEDNGIRVWDITRPEKRTTVKKPLGISVSCYCNLPNRRYVAMAVRTKNENYKLGDVLVYDLVMRKVVRRGAVMDGLPRNMLCIGETEVIIATDTRKIKVVDLNTMTVTRVFEGKLCPYGSKMEIVKDGKELLTLTQGKHGFKTYSIETGKTVNLLHAPPEIRERKHNKFDQYSLTINKTTMACYIEEEGPIVIFDYIKNVCVSVLKMSSRFSTFCGAYLPQDSSYLAVNTYKSFPDPIKQGKMNSLSCIVVYNIQPGKISHWCLDQEYYNMYAKQGVLDNQDSDVDNAILLDDDRLVTSSADLILRVLNIRTGELIKRLEGHTVLPKLVSNHEKSPCFISMANFGEENSLRLWDKESLTCMATYRLDHKIQKVEFCSDGQSLVCMMEDCNLIYWTLVIPGTQSTTMSDCQLTFTGQECDVTLEINNKKDERSDEFDPDDDDDGTSHDDVDNDDDDEEDDDIDFNNFIDDDDQDNEDFDDEDDNNADTDFSENEDDIEDYAAAADDDY